MDFRHFDQRRYPTVSAAEGYRDWSRTYEQSVHDEMDLRLLQRLTSIGWPAIERAADLACGTGRVGAWLRERGVQRIDGIDLVPEMLAQARARGVYDRLTVGDVRSTPLESGQYDLVIQSLADEHFPDLCPLYREASRLLCTTSETQEAPLPQGGGDPSSRETLGVRAGRRAPSEPSPTFVIVGYHPHFLMMGMPTHFHRDDGSAVTIESHIHLLSDHIKAARGEGLSLTEMEEGIVDDAWLAAKPKWQPYRHHPISFAMVFRTCEASGATAQAAPKISTAAAP